MEPSLETDPPPAIGAGMFVADLDFRCELSTDRGAMVGEATLSDALRFPGSARVRPSVLATIADCVAGRPACLVTAPALALTLDIVVRTVGAPRGDKLDMAVTVLKPGRRTVAAEVAFTDPTDRALVAHSYLTFMASPRPQDAAPPLSGEMRCSGAMPTPFPDHVGVRSSSPGVTEIDLVPFVTQGSGTLQGGIVALLGEVAAESLTGRPVVDLDTRYLNAVRMGPGRATARTIGPDLVEVQVADAGLDGRAAASITARVAPRGR
jgi:acyl-coenzyme A thioesterase PaaI-like protein